ncbi:MAG: LysR family transcriptional regulator [Acetobacteraceae bacterium]
MRLSAVDVRDLAVFRAIVEHGGFAGAQLALSMSQSTISFHLKALEERLGFSLCRRGRRGFGLTARGASVYEQSQALATALSTFESGLGELRDRAVGTLRVGIVDTTLTDEELGMANVINRFVDKASQVDLRITIASPEQLVSEMARGSLDLAISPRIEPLPGYRQIDFHQEIHSLYCSRRHPLFGRHAVTKADAEIHPFVVRPYANKSELRHFPNVEVHAHASNMEAQAMHVLSGRLLGYLPDHAARIWGAGGRLRALLAPETQLCSQFAIISPGQQELSLPQRLFMDELLYRAGHATPATTAKPKPAANRRSR